MRMTVSSLLVDDQQRALALYTGALGLLKKNDIPLGEYSWLTLVSPEDPDGHELLLEPDQHPASKAFKAALMEDGIPIYSFTCDDVVTEHERLVATGLQFTQPPTAMGPVTTAVFDDTCGNLIQLVSHNPIS